MLIQFTVENHRSIKESAVVSFAASKDKSLEEHLLHPDAKKALLPAIAIYGANAAGKSNVLHAMMTMGEMVTGDVFRRRIITQKMEISFAAWSNLRRFCISAVSHKVLRTK